MTDQETVITRKRGPKPTGKGQLLGVRLQPDQLAALDAWIAQQQDPQPSRPEAVRRLVQIGEEAMPIITELLAFLENSGDAGDRETQAMIVRLRGIVSR